MKKVREESEVALNEIVYGLGVQLNSIAKNIVCTAAMADTILRERGYTNKTLSIGNSMTPTSS